MSNNRYYALETSGKEASIDIYGDITSWPWLESDVSAYNLSKRIAELTDVDVINVNINSYGGEVAEGLAIYNSLKRHSAKVVTRCDGFACSIASVIFMAGDERIVHEASLLMIHNAWTSVWGANADQLRKQAEDLDTITQASKNAYMANVSIDEDELSALMDAETWLSPQDALDMGFATSVETFEAKNPSQNARAAVFERMTAVRASAAGEPAPEPDPAPAEPPASQSEPEPTADPEPAPEPVADPDPSQQADAFAAFISAITQRKGE